MMTLVGKASPAFDKCHTLLVMLAARLYGLMVACLLVDHLGYDMRITFLYFSDKSPQLLV